MGLNRFNKRKKEAFADKYGKELNRLICEYVIVLESKGSSELLKKSAYGSCNSRWKTLCQIQNSKRNGVLADAKAFERLTKDAAYMNKVREAIGFKKTIIGRLKAVINKLQGDA